VHRQGVLHLDRSRSGFDYLTGDVAFHTVDGFNGNPTLGEFNIDWTAPTSGTITIAGDIWYAQQSQSRSNDFSLELLRSGVAVDTIERGAIAYNSTVGSNRSSPDPLSSNGSITVNSGDVVELIAMRSVGQAAGSADGLRLTITETTGTTAIPEPEAYSLALLGFGLVFGLRSRRHRP